MDDAFGAADSLTPGLVPVGQLTRNAAESAGLMPPQQSLTLQHTPDQDQIMDKTNYTLETTCAAVI